MIGMKFYTLSISLRIILQPPMTKQTLHSFVPLERIGEGTFSSVYKVRRVSDNGIYALKKIKIASLKDKEKQNALNQIRILASLSSDYIVTYKEAFFDENLKLLCIVMEWADEGDLLQKINKHKKEHTLFDQSQIWKIAYHLSNGLGALHQNRVLHRDMKSANIFISKNVYKIGDLNVSKVLSDQKLVKTQTGTPYYASPEVWRDQPYGQKSDIWSLGCILYEICALKPPFSGASLDQLFKNIQRGRFSPIPSKFSNQLRQLIDSCLSLQPQNRPSTQQLLNPRGSLITRCHFFEISTVSSYTQDKRSQPMLSTIKMPFDIKHLNKKLPHPQYQNQTVMNKSLNIPQKNKFFQNYSSIGKRQGTLPTQLEEQRLSKDRNIDGVTTNIKNKAALPEKIKNHLENISNRQASEKIYHKRPKYRIQSSVRLRQRSLIKPIDKTPLLGSAGQNSKKLRPLSCDIRRNHSKVVNARPLSGVLPQNKNKKNPRAIQSEHAKQNESLIGHYCYQRPQPSYTRHLAQRRPNNERCQSADYQRPVNSSYAELKKRFESRQKHLHSSGTYECNNRPCLQQISKSEVNIADKSIPYISKQVYLRNQYVSRKVEKPQNRGYLEEIQNKILSSGNKHKKAVINTSGVNLEAQRVKGTYNQYRQAY